MTKWFGVFLSNQRWVWGLLVCVLPWQLFAFNEQPNRYIEKTFKTEEQAIEKIVHDRKLVKEHQDQKSKYVFQSLIRPRGASDSGRYVMFEKRNHSDHDEYSFILFDMKFNTRSEYLVPRYRDRNTFLGELYSIGNFVNRADYIENTILPVSIEETTDYQTKWGRHYRFEVTQTAPSAFILKVYWDGGKERRLFAEYRIVDPFIRHPRVVEIYPFDDFFGLAVKFTYIRSRADNQDEWVEDILCFNERFLVGKERILVKREYGYELEPEQAKKIYMTQLTYDWDKNLKANRDYFLSGEQRDNLKQ